MLPRLMKMKFSKLFIICFAIIGCLFASESFAREVNYNGAEVNVFVKPGEPTQISFPGKVQGGFVGTGAALELDKQDNFLIVFAKPDISVDGEAVIVHLRDQRTYSIRLIPADGTQNRDGHVEIVDQRPPVSDELSGEKPKNFKPGNAPPSVVSGLMREMILVAEFGKKKGVTGYRRSNKYSGETVLNDGAMEAKIDEIFMGANLWGYVLTVKNLLNTGQKINPATFRLDGTRAVTAQRWDLAPMPLTAEQNIAGEHTGKVYVVTTAKRN